MELSIEIEKPSSVLRKMKIKVPAKIVKSYFEKGLVSVQKDAKLKGFRPGQAPLGIIKQYYGSDVRHRVLHHLIDESFEEALQQKELKTIGQPKIQTPQHQTGEGAHDHTLDENQDLSYEATFEVMPDLKMKGYSGISVEQEKVEITDEQVEKAIESLRQSHGQLVSVVSESHLSESTQTSRVVQMGDFVDIEMSGGLVSEEGIQPRQDMKGHPVIEVGSHQWIPGFEEQLIGMIRGEVKVFRLQFPSDYGSQDLANREAEFTVKVNEIKEKKLPALDDEFAKQAGFENFTHLQAQAQEILIRNQTKESDEKLKSSLLSKVIEKNPFEVPVALIEGQTRILVQNWAQDLKKQGFHEKMIQEAITPEIESLRKKAESQVRTSLILEAIAKEEKITIQPNELDQELDRLAESLKMTRPQVQDVYSKNPDRQSDLEFKLRQEKTIQFLLNQAKIKSVSIAKK